MNARHLTFDAVDKTGSRHLDVQVSQAVVAGWTGRDAAAVKHHIEELQREGVRPPRQVPEFYRVGAAVLTQDHSIQVAGPWSSGEVEAFVLKANDTWWVGVGSDHTDRRLEGYSVTLSKQACPKPLARQLWPLAEVEGHWDSLVTRSWITVDGTRALYQEGSLQRNRHPTELIRLYTQRGGKFVDGTLMLCGTQPTLEGIRYAQRFEFELFDPVLYRTIRHHYDMEVLPADLPED